MTLATLMASDCATILQNTDEHAVSRKVKDEFGKATAIAIIIERKDKDNESNPGGRNLVHRALVGLPSTNTVSDEWKFDVDGDGKYWAVDRDMPNSIQDDGAGWLWVAVIRSPIVERGDPEYHSRG